MLEYTSTTSRGRALLGRRFDHDGAPFLDLNALQHHTKVQIDEKTRQCVYQFEHTACCICGTTDADLLASKDRYGLYMPVVLCKACGLIYTSPRMRQKDYTQFYNVEYRKLYGGTVRPTKLFFDAQYAQGKRIFTYLSMLGSLPRPLAEMSVLEVGCGAGGILKYFQDQGCRVQGLDLGTEYVQYGRTHHQLDLSVGTLAEATLSEAPDLILYSHVLEHILTPNQELAHIRQALAPQGLLYVELPGVKNLMNSYRMDFLRYLQNAHTFHFTLTTLTNLLRKNHFEIVAGDETIQSVFKGDPVGRNTLAFTSDYNSVLAYLHRLEKWRKRLPFPPYVLKQPQFFLPRILKQLGLSEANGKPDRILKQ